MPNEDDRFGDVADQLKRTADDRTDEDGVASAEVPVDDGTDGDSEPTRRPDGSVADESSSGPPFSFDETDMRGFYVRDETWNGVTRMRSSVTAACSVFDVPEFESREFQDACLRVVENHADEVALAILRERGVDADEDRLRDVVEMLSDHAGTD
jgi:hypothetical protein